MLEVEDFSKAGVCFGVAVSMEDKDHGDLWGVKLCTTTLHFFWPQVLSPEG